MAVFRDADDLYECLGGLFDRLLSYPPFATGIREAGVTVRFHHRDPEAVISIVPGTDPPYRWARGEEGPEPSVRIRMDGDVAHEFWLGRLSVPMALATGKIKVEGPTASLMGLIPAIQGVFPIYRDLLDSLGHGDKLPPEG
jgi:hypothetical protein